MYRKETEGWLKHYDFILLDLICLQVAFVLAYALSDHGFHPYGRWLYRNMGIWMVFADFIVLFFLNTFHRVIKRGLREEIIFTLRHVVVLCLLSVLYLFILGRGGDYSRLAMLWTFLLYAVISYIVRILWKKHLQRKRVSGGGRTLLVITAPEIAESVIENLKENNYAGYTIAGIVLMESDLNPQANVTRKDFIGDIPVVADSENSAMYVCREWIDEVMIIPPENADFPKKLMDELRKTGVTIHMNLAKISNGTGLKQFVEDIGGFTVLSTSINYASSRQLTLKRGMDILAGLVGSLITGILFLFVAPVIRKESPDPVFFTQERVGENGKKFRIVKFRSMYMDAEERKAELLKQNKMSDGKMFKMDFNPRVIGNRILPDGTRKTGFGQFLRDSSLDEFPQFFNVLKGDMSLVGTRPPLVGEVSEYELHHRARLSIKPGITGLWQVSGRSDITDFEEVVRLDRKYISEWSLWLDIKILIKTVWVVAKRKGSS
ncbi:MAG: sugar transferase [Clostridiales bacterium]|nr:sugar transferase [Clostridiales bacterium]